MKVDARILYILSLIIASIEMIVLRGYHCPSISIQNGKARYLRKGKYVKFTCNPGYMMLGGRLIICTRGKWDAPPPKCIRPGCKKIFSKPLMNGVTVPSHMDAAIHFYCNFGFQLHGPLVTYCNGSAWSDHMPICLARNTKPEMSCDFEKPDICGWTHDLNHDFEWMRMQYNTPSGVIGTGPSYDHTYGEGRGGYYMYIESSSKNPNDTARLISPIYEKTTTPICFRFFYHMYGATIGTLRVYLRLLNETWGFHPQHAFFEKRGNQGNRWLGYAQLFKPIPEDYQIIIEGVRGSSHVSDIAIDDVSIIEDCSTDLLLDSDPTYSTEDEEVATTELMPDDVYSCENRCYSVAVMDSHHRKCACDENCYERNECCPDYLDYCVLHATTSSELDYTSSTVSVSSTLHTEKAIVIDRRPEPTKNRVLESTTKIIRTTTPSHPTKFENIRTTFEPSVETPKVTVTDRLVHTESTTKITTTTKLVPSTRNNRINKYNKKTTASIRLTTDLQNEIPQIPNNMLPIEDVGLLKSRYNEKIVFSATEEQDYFAVYAVLSGLAVIITTVAIVFIRRRRLRSNGFCSASHGDSTSDVRFLTNDELLDLNLDYE